MPVSQAYQGIADTVFSGLKGERPAPKPGAIPTSLYPDIQFLPLYHGEGENQRFFCLWSFLWSKTLLCRFRQSGKIQQTPVSQGFAAFHLVLPRIPPRHSQSKRMINGPTFELPFDTGQASSPHPNGRASLLRSPAIIPPARRGCKNYLRCAERFGASLARMPFMASCSWRISPCSFLTLHEAFSSVTTALSATTARLRRSADKSASS